MKLLKSCLLIVATTAFSFAAFATSTPLNPTPVCSNGATPTCNSDKAPVMCPRANHQAGTVSCGSNLWVPFCAKEQGVPSQQAKVVAGCQQNKTGRPS